MAVEPASSALVASSSASTESLVPGVRAKTATEVIQKASEKVVGSINLTAMQQSFPDFLESEDDRQFIQLLTDKTGQHLSAGFEVRLRVNNRKCAYTLTKVRHIHILAGGLEEPDDEQRVQGLYGQSESSRQYLCDRHSAASQARRTSRRLEVSKPCNFQGRKLISS